MNDQLIIKFEYFIIRFIFFYESSVDDVPHPLTLWEISMFDGYFSIKKSILENVVFTNSINGMAWKINKNKNSVRMVKLYLFPF